MSNVTLHLQRIVLAATCTLGVLYAGGVQYATVEDTVRPLTHCTADTCVGKIPGKTAIPPGRYEVADTYSPRFKRNVLVLLNVPGFRGIRIHSGNTAEDTEGCLILGLGKTEHGVKQSQAAILKFNAYVRTELAAGKRVFILIE